MDAAQRQMTDLEEKIDTLNKNDEALKEMQKWAKE